MNDEKRQPIGEIVANRLERSVAFEDVPADGLRVRLHADEQDRKVLSERLSVASVDEVEAELMLQWVPGEKHLIAVEGRVRAALVQNCVVTLEPLSETIDAGFGLRLTDLEDDGDGEVDDLERDDGDHDQDPPEYAAEGVIDLGDLVAQQLALEINPFPRADGLPYLDVSTDSDAQIEAGKPFAALAALRDKLLK